MLCLLANSNTNMSYSIVFLRMTYFSQFLPISKHDLPFILTTFLADTICMHRKLKSHWLWYSTLLMAISTPNDGLDGVIQTCQLSLNIFTIALFTAAYRLSKYSIFCNISTVNVVHVSKIILFELITDQYVKLYFHVLCSI
jgi:hypothetical protein